MPFLSHLLLLYVYMQVWFRPSNLGAVLLFWHVWRAWSGSQQVNNLKKGVQHPTNWVEVWLYLLRLLPAVRSDKLLLKPRPILLRRQTFIRLRELLFGIFSAQHDQDQPVRLQWISKDAGLLFLLVMKRRAPTSFPSSCSSNYM